MCDLQKVLAVSRPDIRELWGLTLGYKPGGRAALISKCLDVCIQDLKNGPILKDL